MDPFSYLCCIFIFGMLPCLFLAALWSPAGKGLADCSHVCCSWSGMVLAWHRFLIFAFLFTFTVALVIKLSKHLATNALIRLRRCESLSEFLLFQ